MRSGGSVPIKHLTRLKSTTFGWSWLTDSEGFSQNSTEIASIVGMQNAESIHVKTSDPQDDWNLSFCREAVLF